MALFIMLKAALKSPLVFPTLMEINSIAFESIKFMNKSFFEISNLVMASLIRP